MTQGQHDRAVTENPVVPVTLITGFLGAGKTSLINHVLAGDNGQKFAVIVNEFGAIGIDHDLIVSSTETLLELSNGCVCCTIRGDLVQRCETCWRGLKIMTVSLLRPPALPIRHR